MTRSPRNSPARWSGCSPRTRPPRGERPDPRQHGAVCARPMSPLGHPDQHLLRDARVSYSACSRIEIMKPNNDLILSTLVLLALAVAVCSDGEHAVAGPGKLTSIDVQRGTNPIKAQQGAAKRASRRPGSPPKALR